MMKLPGGGVRGESHMVGVALEKLSTWCQTQGSGHPSEEDNDVIKADWER